MRSAADYTALTFAFERCRVPQLDIPSRAVSFMFKKALVGAAPVQNDHAALDNAVQAHVAGNWNMLDVVRTRLLKDDTVPLSAAEDLPLTSLGTQPEDLASLRASGVALCSYSGAFDSGSIRAAARLWHGVAHQSPGHSHRFVIGPWQHGARTTCSPFAPEGSSRGSPKFDMYDDLANWLDVVLDNRGSLGNSGTSASGV